MEGYKKANPKLWTGRSSDQKLYLHEKVKYIDLKTNATEGLPKKSFAILGYDCDEGVRRNQGRIGAAEGPDAIRSALAKLPNHLSENTDLFDLGSIRCIQGDMETAQIRLAEYVEHILKQNCLPILLGGGHDIAYGHYKGIRQFLGKDKRIGIINFDAHFDLRSNNIGNNSGTPFFQIAQDCATEGTSFHYLCLGIRKDANTRVLFQSAKELGVRYIEKERFNMYFLEEVQREVLQFIEEVDCIYTSIDMDGFSSAYAPGVSSPYPSGYSPEVVFEVLRSIVHSKKVIGIDVAEMNPSYDIDNQTAKMAAALLHFAVHQTDLLQP
ncbi:MAG: formimidoylglutamase [Flavobacteriales bacterium]|nr:MAG: formimidoylglutamase [Flavobacteriales bacterium]